MIRHTRSAFTLVELLVVAAMMAVLFGLLIAGFRGNDRSAVRQAAQIIASELLRAEARAMRQPYGSAILFRTVDGGTAATTSDGLLYGMPQPPLLGKATISIGAPPATSANVNVTSLTNGDSSDIEGVYKVRWGAANPFGDSRGFTSDWSTWLAFSPASSIAFFRSSSGQTQNNTIWPPQPPPPTGWDVEMARSPAVGDLAAALPKDAVIHLGFSGCGSDPTATSFSLWKRGVVGITFDRRGLPDDVVTDVRRETPAPRSAPRIDDRFYLFVVPIKVFDVKPDERQSLASPDALWVTVVPESGRVTVSPNVPQSVNDSLLDSPDKTPLTKALQDARARARLGQVIR